MVLGLDVAYDDLTNTPEFTFRDAPDFMQPDSPDHPTAPDYDWQITDGYTVGDGIEDAPTVGESIGGIVPGFQALGEEVTGNKWVRLVVALLGIGIASYVLGQLFTISLG